MNLIAPAEISGKPWAPDFPKVGKTLPLFVSFWLDERKEPPRWRSGWCW
jgi:hypothetical protein